MGWFGKKKAMGKVGQRGKPVPVKPFNATGTTQDSEKLIPSSETSSPQKFKVGITCPCIAFHSGLKEWTAEDWALQEKLKEMIFQQLALAMKTGDVAGAEAQTLVLLHRKWLHLFWKEGMYTKQNHLMIGKIYVAEPRFAEFYDGRVGRGGAVFLRDAIEIYVLRGGAVVDFPGLGQGKIAGTGRTALDSGGMVTVAHRKKK